MLAVLRFTLVGVVLMLANPCLADDGDYRRIIGEALVEFEHGRWTEAYALFTQAHELAPSARTLRGMGVVSYELGEYPQALKHLQACLVSPERPLQAQDRDEVVALIARIGRLIGTLSVRLEPPEALLFVNHQQTNERELKVSVGKVTLQAELAGHAPRTRVLNVAGGKHYSVTLSLTPLQVAQDEPGPRTAQQQTPITVAAPADPGADRNDSKGGSVWRSPWLWVGVGAVVAAGVVTAVVLSQSGDTPGQSLPPGNVGTTFSALVGP